MWSIRAAEYYYSALKKRKEIPTRATIWMNLVDTALSERSQSQRDEHWMIPLVGGTWSCQTHRERRQDGGPRDWCGGWVGSCLGGDRASVWEDGKVLQMDGGDSCTIGVYIKPLNWTLQNGYNGPASPLSQPHTVTPSPQKLPSFLPLS